MKNNKFGWVAIVEGILLALLGIFSLTIPVRMIGSYLMLYAIAIIVMGFVDIVAYFSMGNKSGFVQILSLITGILSVIAGFILLFYPGAKLFAAALFAIWFAIWFMLHCVSRISHLCAVRAALGKGAFIAGLIFNILGIILGVVMMLHPLLTDLIVTYILGIFLILAGIDCFAAAFDGETKAG